MSTFGESEEVTWFIPDELDELCMEELGINYDVELDYEMYETIQDFDVTGKIDKWDEIELLKWKESEGESPGRLGETILNELARKGIIETGTYLVRDNN